MDKQRARIFISYKRNQEPDEPIALQVYKALGEEHDVFIDQKMLVGTDWTRRIEEELHQADFLITLLSANSIYSEMVKGEIETAHQLSKERNGRPVILPVRLAYREPFQYPLSAYLNPINWAFWEGPRDTPGLVEELRRAVSGGELSISQKKSKDDLVQVSPALPLPPPLPAAQMVSLEMPEGTMDLQSRYYVLRASDEIALGGISRRGVTITIKGPRQIGKSSLLVRTMQAAVKTEKKVGFIDFQLFDKETLSNSELFYRRFCSSVTDELDMEDRVDQYWSAPLSNNQRCTRYFQRYLLKELNSQLVLAMDEVERVFDTDFRSDFFSMLRSWHNGRATNPIWKQLDLALVTSTEPYQLIEDLNQSPFNVGEVVELSDFTPDQVADLNRRHGSPLTIDEESRLRALVGGHPYLIRRAFYLVASRRISASQLFAEAIADSGPFHDHLGYHLFRLYGKEGLIKGLRQVICNQICPDELVFFRLRGAGLVRRENSKVVTRCPLYAQYFKEHVCG